MVWLVAMIVGAGAAWGADCDAPYALDTLADDLGAIEAGILSADAAVAERGAALEKGLSCLDGVSPRVVVGRAYRAIAVAQSGDEGAAARLTTAAAVDPGFQYSLEELPDDDHPAFAAWREALEKPVPELKPAVGYVWASGTFYLDGVLWGTGTSVPAASIAVGQVWTCEVRNFDGERYGEPYVIVAQPVQ